MVPEPTLNKIDSRSDYSFHNESVLLINESRLCFGYELDEFLNEILENSSGYGDYFECTPHSDGYELLCSATAEEKVVSLENSAWLVEANCFDDDDLDLLRVVQSDVPPQTQLFVWSSPNKSLRVDLDDIDQTSHKIFLTRTEETLRSNIKSYFSLNCHPRRTSHCIDWQNEARRQQEMII